MSRFRIASYNIRKCVGLDRRRDPDRVLRVIGAFKADVVVLQEADRRLPPRPSALPEDAAVRLGMTALDVDPSTPSIGFHGNALLIGPALRCEALRGIDLPGLEPRGAIIAELSCDGLHFRVVATHLGLIRRNRLMQLETILAALREGPDLPTVIAGDFNEWSARNGIAPLDGYRVLSPGLTFHAAQPVAPLDRFALSPGLAALSTEVVRGGEAGRASDHLPILADLEVRGG